MVLPKADNLASQEARLDAAAALIWAAVLFNLVLCFVDTQILRLSPLAVIAAEAAILGLALLLPLTQHQRSPGRFDALLLLLFGTWLLLSILRQDVDPKLFRDVAIIPVFVLLGLTSRGGRFHSGLFWMHMVIVVIALWEALSPRSFVTVFSIADFFAHTRGSNSDDWWVDSGLYISAVRPEERFLFPDLPLHRLSSVFLEPVSLGNYVVIATIWLAGFWRQIPLRMRPPAVIGTLFLLLGSDSRMATVACSIILLAFLIRRTIPWFLPALIAPLVIAVMLLAVRLFDLQSGLDTFGGRIAHAAELFGEMSLSNWTGLSLDRRQAAEDAGFAYVIMTQSLPIAALLWAALFLRHCQTVQGRFVHLAIALYVALNLTVSWSIFSIKTAALLWMLLGRSIREDAEAASGEADQGAALDPRRLRRKPFSAGQLSRET